MKLTFKCTKCDKAVWLINYISDEKAHELTCANCGDMIYLEDVFGNSRRPKNARKPSRPKGPNTTILMENKSNTDGKSDKIKATSN